MEFLYKARTKEGKLQSGIVEASTRQTALEVLQRHQLTVVSLEEEKIEGFLFRQISWQRVRASELAAFSRSFATLFDAGVPLIEALRVLADQSANPYLRRIILEIVDDVDGGMKLSQAMGKHPKAFSDFYVNMIKAGETSGALQKTLLYLADYTERDYKLKTNIRNALIYPVFVISVFIIVFLVMAFFVLPRLTQVLSQLGTQELPFTTRMLIWFSNFTFTLLPVIILLLGVIASWVVYYMRGDEGRHTWDRIQLKLPIFGPLLKTIYQARFAGNLSTLIRGGIPIVEAMQITSQVVGNSIYASLIAKIVEEVKAGNTIESVVRSHEEFSPLLTQMIAVGERSGKLEEILGKVALFFETDVDRTVNGLSTLIEPVLIIILGIGIGILVAAIILPIYSIIGSGAGVL